MNGPRRDISPERQGIYYLGMGLMAIGAIVFISAIFGSLGRDSETSPFDSGPGQFSPMEFDRAMKNSKASFDEFEQRSKNSFGTMLFGMGLVVAGGFLMSLVRAGAAGSGLILDPQQARRDLEPWSRATGGMVADAIEEVPVIKEALDSSPPKEVIKIRCQACKHLNDESAKFCEECGVSLLAKS